MQNTTAVFPTVEQATAAIDELEGMGVPRSAVRYLGKDSGHAVDDAVELSEDDALVVDEEVRADGETHSTGEPVEGALKGGVIGAVAGAAALLIPGVAPLGLAAVATGAIVGAASGSIGELLEGVAYDKDDVVFYNERIEQGGVLVAVQRDDTVTASDEDILAVLHRHGGERRS